MPARTLTIRGVPDSVLRSLRSQAQASRRSLNAELLVVLERAAAEGQTSGAPAVREARPAPYGTPSAKAPSFPAGVDRRALAEVCRRHHIQRLALFGSRATGAARLDSDVDVVVEFEPGMTPGFGIVGVAEALRPVLGDAPVDLVTWRGLRSPLRERVQATAVPLYGG
jgi:hypothetical protein